MVLKEAFHAQNVLTKWLTDVERRMAMTDLFVKTKEKHLKSKAYSEAEDEEIEVLCVKESYRLLKADGSAVSASELLGFALQLVDEKCRLSDAIRDAKHTIPFDLDNAINIANVKRSLSEYVTNITSIKSSATKSEGIGYKMDNEGKQTSYRYPIECVKTIDFDRNHFRKIQRTLITEANSTSNYVDKAMVTTDVTYESIFDFDGSLSDAVETYFSTVMGAEK